MSAWAQYYKRGLKSDPGTPLAYGCIAIKYELDYNGFLGDMVPSYPGIGESADKSIRAFQKSARVEVDGVVGPVTAEALFQKRSLYEERKRRMPEGIVRGVIAIESAFDPAAVGSSDQDDLGLVQINRRAHPDLPLSNIWRPAFSVPWCADYLRQGHDGLGDWDAAIASYNIGFGGASSWLRAGFPKEGGVNGIYGKATDYVGYVKRYM